MSILEKKGAFIIFFNRKGQDDKPEVVMMDTEVYACTSCNGWMRKEFASTDLKCPLCGNDTSPEMRELPQIE
ncbi:cold-inducible protein YdjO-related protein [Bacillus sp. DTU_2020_1000418_1_SI_GHA_SEK_038]|uniref:cold-inducible protein YdjO-related protein n=1 Tax=Bacillus sp. DTU_2020_1000418_1_SI_GHA_SEK_038 TaxID=3077585 RepID=UPI0028E5BE0C|nr:cold-inducible protein YdjO-related protein [Bacillus sp. DTU_2020_1000418_1_SI_GHA_SEK_038]WNS73498.1 cold-inducible protein YdjO-related protein [Bacillus sp. DTU_2020_1000418_1_SI_GHA_SEK_038]